MIREISASIFAGVSATAGSRANGKRFSVRACPGGSIIAACDLDHFLFAQFPFYIFSGAVRTGLTAGESEPDRSGSFFAALWIFRFRHNQKEPLAAAQEKKTVNRYDDLTGRLREMIYHFVRHFVQR